MDRKEFLKCACGFGIGSGAALIASEADAARAAAPTEEAQTMTQREKFAHDWVRTLMTNMDTQLDESSRVALMEASGRACARRGAVKAALDCGGDLERLLSTLRKWVGEDKVIRNGKQVRLTYGKCLCPIVQSGSERLSDTYCNCSRGWVREMFETVCGKPVDVQLKESIKRGGKACRFIVQV